MIRIFLGVPGTRSVGDKYSPSFSIGVNHEVVSQQGRLRYDPGSNLAYQHYFVAIIKVPINRTGEPSDDVVDVANLFVDVPGEIETYLSSTGGGGNV